MKDKRVTGKPYVFMKSLTLVLIVYQDILFSLEYVGGKYASEG